MLDKFSYLASYLGFSDEPLRVYAVTVIGKGVRRGNKFMNAAVKWSAGMGLEDRVAKLESDMSYVRSDLAEVKNDVKAMQGEIQGLRVESHSFRTEAAKEFGSLRAELYDFKTEVAKEFGLVRAEMAKEFGSVRAAIEQSKLWMLVTGVATIAMLFVTLGHTLKLF